MKNQTPWDTLTYDDDGEWIGESLRDRNLAFACDGSYMEKPREVFRSVCPAVQADGQDSKRHSGGKREAS